MRESARKHAHDIFNRRHVRKAIELLLQTRAGVTKAWIVDQLVCEDDSDRPLRVGRRWVRLKDSAEIDRENIGSVAEIEDSRVVDKKGNDVVTIKIKQHSRHRALRDLAKIVRMEVERQEISGPGGGPVEVTEYRRRSWTV